MCGTWCDLDELTNAVRDDLFRQYIDWHVVFHMVGELTRWLVTLGHLEEKPSVYGPLFRLVHDNEEV